MTSKENNYKISEWLFDSSVNIEKIYYLAAETAADKLSDDLVFDFFNDHSAKEINKILGTKLTQKELNELSECDYRDIFIFNKLNGFLVQLGIHHRSNFQYRSNGEFYSCNVLPWHRHLRFIYIEDWSEFLDKAQKVYDADLIRMEKEDKKENKKLVKS